MSHSQKVTLITGATGGIGQAIAIGLAKLGGTIVIVGRDKDRGQTAVAEIKAQSGNSAIELMLADLSSQRDLRKLASDFLARYDRLDVLVNNVGGLYGKRWESADGIEGMLALNHLGPFLLTHLLLPLLQASAPARIVNINSEGHRSAKTFDFEAFRAWKRGFPIYSQTKLANLLFSYELAKRLEGTGITVNAVHPGMVDTQLFRRFITERFGVLGGAVTNAITFVVRQIAYRSYKFDSAETAAGCPIYLASSDEVAGVTGKYFNCDKRLMETSPASHDAALSAHVWKVSAEMCGLPAEIALQGMNRNYVH